MKVWNYVVIMIGMMIVLELAGIDVGSAQIFGLIGLSFNALGDVSGVTLSANNFFNALFGNTGLLIGLGAGLVVASFFTKAKPENLILLPFITGTLVLFIQVNNAIISRMVSIGDVWAASLMVVFLVPFAVGFIVSLGEFFRGTD